MREIIDGASVGGVLNETATSMEVSPKFDEQIAKCMLEKARIKVVLDNIRPSEDKHLIILGGQLAAGKSSITKELFNQYSGNIVLLNGDEFKPFYPNYKNVNKMMTARGASEHDFNNLNDLRASIDSSFDKVFEQVRDAAQKLENTPVIDKDDKEVKEFASAMLSFDANTTINEVLNSFEKYEPHIVEEIRNSNSLDYHGTSIDLGYLDAKTVAEHLRATRKEQRI